MSLHNADKDDHSHRVLNGLLVAMRFNKYWFFPLLSQGNVQRLTPCTSYPNAQGLKYIKFRHVKKKLQGLGKDH